MCNQIIYIYFKLLSVKQEKIFVLNTADKSNCDTLCKCDVFDFEVGFKILRMCSREKEDVLRVKNEEML